MCPCFIVESLDVSRFETHRIRKQNSHAATWNPEKALNLKSDSECKSSC